MVATLVVTAPVSTSRAAADDFFDIETVDVAFGGDGPEGDGNDPALPAVLRTADTATIEFASRPEMVIIDHGVLEAGATPPDLVLRSLNGGVWSEWTPLHGHDADAPDGLPGEEGSQPLTAVGPVWIGDDAEAIEIQHPGGGELRLTVEALDSNDPTNDDPTTDPGAIDAANRSAFAVGDQPPIRPRSSWTSAGWSFDNEGCDRGPTSADNIRTAVVHHTVTTNSYAASQVDDILRGIHRFHTVNRGWCDIGYNFVVDRFGTIWEARTGSIADPIIGGHSKGFNTWTVGIALLGQHQSGAQPAAASPTAASLESVRLVAEWKLSLHGVDPQGRNWLKNRSTTGAQRHPSLGWIQSPAIVGHTELGVTSCPGTLVVPAIPGMGQSLVEAHNAIRPPIPGDLRPENGPAIITMNGWGGFRAVGAAAPIPAITQPTGVAAIGVAGRNDRGQVLMADGTLIAYGGAQPVSGKPARSRRAIDIAAGVNGDQGWVLEIDGRIYHYGGATDRTAPVKPAAGQSQGFALLPNGKGYILDRSGGLFAVDGVPDRSIGTTVDALDIALRPNGTSGWVLDRTGRLHPFGGAPDVQPELAVSRPVAVLVGSEHGGWVMDAEGRMIRFGTERRVAPVNTTVGNPVRVAAAITGWDYGEDQDDVRYAAELERRFLGRTNRVTADHTESRLEEIGSGPVVEDLATSDAWAGRVVDELYRDVLGRAADAQGRAFWVAQLRDGLRTQDLGANFYGSTEYFASAGSTETYVRRLYRELLDRDPDPEGLWFWTTVINEGELAPHEVTAGFYQSVESRRDRVDKLYEAFLDREPDPEGHAYWADQLLVIDDIRLAIQLAVSEEFYDRAIDAP